MAARRHGVQLPLRAYLARLQRFANLDPFPFFLMMAVLVERFLVKVSVADYYMLDLCPYKMASTALFLVQKMHQDDECWYLREFSVITGLS